MAGSTITFNPGELRHRISLLKESTVTDISGTSVQWAEFATTRAKIYTLSARQVLQAGRDISETVVMVEIRYRADLPAAMRVQTRNSTYTVQAIENVEERNIKLVLTCIGLGTNN